MLEPVARPSASERAVREIENRLFGTVLTSQQAARLIALIKTRIRSGPTA